MECIQTFWNRILISKATIIKLEQDILLLVCHKGSFFCASLQLKHYKESFTEQSNEKPRARRKGQKSSITLLKLHSTESRGTNGFSRVPHHHSPFRQYEIRETRQKGSFIINKWGNPSQWFLRKQFLSLSESPSALSSRNFLSLF